MDEATIGASSRAAARRHRLVLLLCTGGLAAGVVGLATIGASGLGLLGLALLAAAGVGVLALSRSPGTSPGPRAAGLGTVVESSRGVGLTALVGVVGIALVILSLELDDGLLEAAREGRRGGLLLLGVPLIPIALVWCGLVVLRPDGLLVHRAGLAIRRGGRRRVVPWDRVGSIRPLPSNQGVVLAIQDLQGTPARLATRHLALTPWAVRDVVEHYRDHPADRVELGTPRSLERVEASQQSAGPRSST